MTTSTRPQLKINQDSLKERKEYKRHKVNQGDNIYRILPPFGEAANGYPYKAWTLSWLPDPATGRNRPYASTRSFGEKDCPITEYTKALETKYTQLSDTMKSKGVDDATVRERLKGITKLLMNIKPKTSYFYNATNKAGEVGILELKKTAHDGIKKQMMQYITDYGQDPTSLNSDENDSGVWFKVRRDGELTNTEYSVLKNQTKQKIGGQLVFVDDRSELPQNIVDSYPSLGYDLTTLYKKVSYDELKNALLSALTAVYDSVPEARIAGFDPDSDSVEVKAAPVRAQSAPKAVVNLKFASDDEGDDAPFDGGTVVATVQTAATQAASPTVKRAVSNTDNDDVFKHAMSLLNS